MNQKLQAPRRRRVHHQPRKDCSGQVRALRLARREHGPPPPLPVDPNPPTDPRFPRKAPPNLVKYKGPPHGAFVRGIRSRSPQGDRPARNKPKPLTLVHPQRRARNSYHDWAKGEGRGSASSAGAASGAPRPPPQVLPRTPPSERVQINIVLDWHKCLDRGWGYTRKRFTNRTALAINSLCAALRPCTINILSYAQKNANLYLRRDLIPAQRQIEALPSRPAFVRVAQVSARVGPNGKGRQLHFVQAHFFVDDKPQIVNECRRTGCVCIRAYLAAGEQGLIWKSSNTSIRLAVVHCAPRGACWTANSLTSARSLSLRRRRVLP